MGGTQQQGTVNLFGIDQGKATLSALNNYQNPEAFFALVDNSVLWTIGGNANPNTMGEGPWGSGQGKDSFIAKWTLFMKNFISFSLESSEVWVDHPTKVALLGNNRLQFSNGESGRIRVMTYIYAFGYTSIYVYIYINVHIYIYMYICMHCRMHRHNNTALRYTYIHIYIYTLTRHTEIVIYYVLCCLCVYTYYKA